MVCGEEEDAGGLSPVKDDNEAARHFIRRTLPILGCVDYISLLFLMASILSKGKAPLPALFLYPMYLMDF